MVYVPGDTFRMGSPEGAPGAYGDESPDHDVTVSSFFIGRFPVTQALWKAVMKDDNPSFFKGDERPVEQVSWDRITNEFLPALKDMTGIAFRLPTEAEWEYAARGGPYHKDGLLYAGSNKLKEVGWFEDNSHLETKPAGLKRPNQLGLYDMSGNVWEWCQDQWHDNYNGAPKDGSASEGWFEEGVYRVIRSGGYLDEVQTCRTANRYLSRPALVHRLNGFRLAASFQGGD
ncbi:MAG: formylglycine-generating enzyme family protein [Saprospiraceae bacterium]|nr:formylglycine-generating enzyme family protein [Saprospiraceae bacterium]